MLLAGPTLIATAALAAPTWATFAMVSLSTVSTGAILLALNRMGADLKSDRRELAVVRHEVEALNLHSIVSLTDTDARICHVNKRFIEATGYQPDEVVGKAPAELYADPEATDSAALHARLASGNLWTGETALRCKDGSVIITHTTILPRMNRNGDWVGSVAVRTDITDARTASAARDTVATLHKLAEPVVLIDPETQSIEFMNEAALQLTGWTDETRQGMTLGDVPFDGNRTEISQNLRDIVVGRTGMARFNLTFKDRIYSTEVQRIEPKYGKQLLFAIMRDVTDAIEIERVKHEFVSNVSHEMRTPLTAIKGSLGLSLSGAAGELPPKAKGLLEIAYRNANRLVLIVNDILDLEKIAAGKMDFDMHPVDLNATLDEAVLAVQSYADQYQVGIEVVRPVTPAMATVDNDRFLQVLTNLISNACKFSKPGSRITLELETSGQNHIIRVRDRGEGIPADAQETIFDRFSQVSGKARRSKGGSGLGLSIVKAIVESHGGTVDLQSTENVGTVVTITLRKLAENIQYLPEPPMAGAENTARGVG